MATWPQTRTQTVALLVESMRTFMSASCLVEKYLIAEQQRHPESLMTSTYQSRLETLKRLVHRASIEGEALSHHLAALPASSDRVARERAVRALRAKTAEISARLAQITPHDG
jgi:hypothetical protein